MAIEHGAVRTGLQRMLLTGQQGIQWCESFAGFAGLSASSVCKGFSPGCSWPGMRLYMSSVFQVRAFGAWAGEDAYPTNSRKSEIQ